MEKLSDEIIELLTKVDAALEGISVSGADVYAMVKVRTALKQAFDLLNKPEKGCRNGL